MESKSRVEIKVTRAELIRDTNTFTTMDCFFIAKSDGFSHFSKVAHGSGKTPWWDE